MHKFRNKILFRKCEYQKLLSSYLDIALNFIKINYNEQRTQRHCKVTQKEYLFDSDMTGWLASKRCCDVICIPWVGFLGPTTKPQFYKLQNLSFMETPTVDSSFKTEYILIKLMRLSKIITSHYRSLFWNKSTPSVWDCSIFPYSNQIVIGSF